MVHNLTERVAIVAPISRLAAAVPPAILGAWLGGFAYTALWAVFFLAVGAGAIFQVFIAILGRMGELKGLLVSV